MIWPIWLTSLLKFSFFIKHTQALTQINQISSVLVEAKPAIFASSHDPSLSHFTNELCMCVMRDPNLV